jgi:hypothetical protein
MQDSAHDSLYPLAASIDACMTDEAYRNDHSLRTLISLSEDSCRLPDMVLVGSSNGRDSPFKPLKIYHWISFKQNHQ